jgi:hypothetical protein
MTESKPYWNTYGQSRERTGQRLAVELPSVPGFEKTGNTGVDHEDHEDHDKRHAAEDHPE